MKDEFAPARGRIDMFLATSEANLALLQRGYDFNQMRE
jgi:hypothetical protein